MLTTKSALLQRIEDEVLDEDRSLAGALRKCIAFGSRVGSSELEAWASQELHGYETSDAMVPTYRTIYAPLAVDSSVPPYGKIEYCTVISSRVFPEYYRNLISEQLTLRQPVEELEVLVADCERKGEPLKPESEFAPLLVKYLNRTDGRPGQRALSLYWVVNTATARGMLGRIRTVLVQFVAELRTQAGEDVDQLSAAQTREAFTVVFNGYFPSAKIDLDITAGDRVAEKKITKIKGVRANVKGANAPVIIGSSDVTVDTTTAGVDLEKAGQFAQYITQIAGTLGLGDDDQRALQSAAGDLEAAVADHAATDHGRVRNLINRVVGLVCKGVPSAAAKVGLSLAEEAAKQPLPAIEQFIHHL